MVLNNIIPKKIFPPSDKKIDALILSDILSRNYYSFETKYSKHIQRALKM